MAISEIIEQIRKATYAKDVREAIASGIEQIDAIAQSVRDDADEGAFTPPSFSFRGEWSSGGVRYLSKTSGRLDLVRYKGSVYLCKSTHESSITRVPTNTTYWSLFARGIEEVVDSGWVQLSTVSDKTNAEVSAVSSGAMDEIRKIGKVVHLRGALTPTSTGAGSTSLVVCENLSEEYRPSKSEFIVQHGSGVNKCLLSVSNNGKLTLSNFADNDAEAQPIPSGALMYLSASWLVD